jgi:hypothetical protein
MMKTLKKLVEANCVETVWAILIDEMNRHGFDRLLYGFTRFRTATTLGNREDMMVLSNHTDVYVEKFFVPEIFSVAPMVDWASKNVGAMSWSWLIDHADELTEAQNRVVEFNREHGVITGYTISFPDSSSRQKAAIALTAKVGLSQTKVDAIWRRKGEEIHFFNQVAHLKMASLPFPEALRRLSKRQREVLEWVSDGKTTQDTATILGLTAALGVDTSARAVMKASLQRQLFVLEV